MARIGHASAAAALRYQHVIETPASSSTSSASARSRPCLPVPTTTGHRPSVVGTQWARRRVRRSRTSVKPVTRAFPVETMGLEPTTPCLQSRCSSQLSYVPWSEPGYGFGVAWGEATPRRRASSRRAGDSMSAPAAPTSLDRLRLAPSTRGGSSVGRPRWLGLTSSCPAPATGSCDMAEVASARWRTRSGHRAGASLLRGGPMTSTGPITNRYPSASAPSRRLRPGTRLPCPPTASAHDGTASSPDGPALSSVSSSPPSTT